MQINTRILIIQPQIFSSASALIFLPALHGARNPEKDPQDESQIMFHQIKVNE